jgi:autotransporter strand-loop-strand O-heptosyltransferase
MKQLTDISTEFYSKYVKAHDVLNDRLIFAASVEEESDLSVLCHFIDGPFVEINNPKNYDLGHKDTPEYKVFFINNETGEVLHSTAIKPGMWTRCNIKYYVPWKIEILDSTGALVYLHVLDLKDKRVAIMFESKSLGDNLAWAPVLKSVEQHFGCHVSASTYINEYIHKGYPSIDFYEPGDQVHNLYALYRIGWFSKEEGTKIDFSMNPVDYRKRPLQATAYDIMGLQYRQYLDEKTPVMVIPSNRTVKPLTPKPYYTIATMSTCQAKFWNSEDGWDTVVKYLNDQGYDVIHLSHEEDGYMGNYRPKGVIQMPKSPLVEVMHMLKYSEGFIGIGSGLSWLAWAMQKPVVLISGFSEPFTEMVSSTLRISQDSERTCSGCFNTEIFDRGDWNWCPMHKGTSRQFECTKKIKAQRVIDAVESLRL